MDLRYWPSVRDVTLQLKISQPYVHALLRSGKLRMFRTRAGILIDPDSVAEFVATWKPQRRSA